MTAEPNIIIDGVTLTTAQAMTMRVAIEAFASQLHEEGLGDDEHGRKMVAGYLRAIDDIRKAMGLL